MDTTTLIPQSNENTSQLPNYSTQIQTPGATAPNQPNQNHQLDQGATAPLIQTDNRNQVTRLYLTYPQCQTPKERVMSNLKNLSDSLKKVVKYYVIAEETHESGDPHLHVVLGFEDRMRLSSKTLHNALDKLVQSDHHPEGKHGNYQIIRSLPRVLRYVTKDKKYLIHGIQAPNPNQDEKTRKRKEMEEVVQTLWEGTTPSQVMEQYTTFYFAQRKKITEFAQDVQLRNLSIKKLEPIVNIQITSHSLSTSSLTSWLKANIMEETRNKREPRQKQLWLHGPPLS